MICLLCYGALFETKNIIPFLFPHLFNASWYLLLLLLLCLPYCGVTAIGITEAVSLKRN